MHMLSISDSPSVKRLFLCSAYCARSITLFISFYLVVACTIEMGLDPNHQMTERDIHYYELPDEIGDNWRDLARALGYKEAKIKSIEKEKGNSNKECCIELLVRWLHKKGKDATAGKLAEALIGIEIKSAADRLIKPNDQSQVRSFTSRLIEKSDAYVKNMLFSV